MTGQTRRSDCPHCVAKDGRERLCGLDDDLDRKKGRSAGRVCTCLVGMLGTERKQVLLEGINQQLLGLIESWCRSDYSRQLLDPRLCPPLSTGS
jgi:hypothetical protein